MRRAVSAGAFKEKCLELAEEVAANRDTIVITKRSKPIARLVPTGRESRGSLFGFFKGHMTITGDIISPIDVEWDVLKE